MSNRNKLFLILLSGFLLRLMGVFLFDREIAGDSQFYHDIALSLVQGYGFGDIDAGPLYPVMITPFVLIPDGWWVICMKLLNVLMSTAVLLIVYQLGKELFNLKTGFISVAIFSIYPYAIFWTSYITPDILLSFLVLYSLLYFVKFQKSKRIWHLVLGSILLAISVYAKPLTLSTPAFLLIWLWLVFRDLKPTLKYIGIIAVIMLVITIPWNIRQYYYYGKLTLVPVHFADNFAWGNNPNYLEREKKIVDLKNWFNTYQEDRNEDYYTARENLLNKTIKHIIVNPCNFLKNTLHKFTLFWQLYPHGPPRNTPFNIIIALTQNLPMVILGTLGAFYFLKKDPAKYSLPVLLVINFTLVHSLIVAHARYRLPIEPIMVLFGVGLVCHYIDSRKKKVLSNEQ